MICFENVSTSPLGTLYAETLSTCISEDCNRRNESSGPALVDAGGSSGSSAVESLDGIGWERSLSKIPDHAGCDRGS
jgi:hypothetical protein